MTPPSWFEKVRPWLLPAAGLVLILLLVLAWNSASRAKDDLTKMQERYEKLQGMLVEKEASQKELRVLLEDMEKRVPEMKAQIAELTSRVGKTTVKEVVRIVTVPGSAGGEARDCPVSPQPDGGTSSPSPAGKCLLVQGDQMRADVDVATLETKAGNKVLLGAASCWRLTPTETMLYRGNFQVSLSSAVEVAEPASLGWGAGIMFVATSDKVGVGPELLFPPFRVMGLGVDASAGFAAGTRGFVAALGRVGVRFPR